MIKLKDLLNEGKPGLWANIRAKQARGEKPAHGNSDAHKDAVKAAKEINKEESVNEEASFFSKLKKGTNIVGKFPPYKEFIVLSTDGKKSASVKDLKTGKTIDIYSTNNYKLKESVNESDIGIATNVVMIFTMIAQMVLLGTSIGNALADRGIGPIDAIKKWWNDRKSDRAIKSISNKIKTDPEIIAFLKLSPSQQRGKFRALVATKLSGDELSYLNKINKSNLKEYVNEAKSPYEVYHKSYTSAIEAAREYAEKKGFEIDNDDAFTKIGMGPRKPSEGKTNKFSIQLSKDGKLQRKQLHIQVYGMRNSYELNAYIG